MDRIVIVGLFTALKKLCEKEDVSSVKEIVDAVLYEAVLANETDSCNE